MSGALLRLFGSRSRCAACGDPNDTTCRYNRERLCFACWLWLFDVATDYRHPFQVRSVA